MYAISEKSQKAIQQFLQQWWEGLSWQARETVAGAQIMTYAPKPGTNEGEYRVYPATPEALYNQLFGHTLREIAAAAEGLLPDDEATRGTAYEACQQVAEWMWARPGMPGSYHIPWDQWSATPVGDLVLRALLWCGRDELITITRAAEMTGRTIRGLSEMVLRGRLQGYSDPDEPNPRRATRVRRSDVEKLPPPR